MRRMLFKVVISLFVRRSTLLLNVGKLALENCFPSDSAEVVPKPHHGSFSPEKIERSGICSPLCSFASGSVDPRAKPP